jgi:hypothetical protein
MREMEAARAALLLLCHRHGRASDGGARHDDASGSSSSSCEPRWGTSGGGLGRDVVVGWAGTEEFQRKMSWAAKVNWAEMKG